jgi:hypothetical protein
MCDGSRRIQPLPTLGLEVHRLPVGPQLGVEAEREPAVVGDQLRVRAHATLPVRLLHDRAVIHEHDVVAVLGRGQTVGDHHHGFAYDYMCHGFSLRHCTEGD